MTEKKHKTKPIILDGGMGQTLLARSKRAPTPLWSAKFLLEMPELVEQLHYDYLASGSDVITLNSYTVTPGRLLREGLSFADFKAMQLAAIQTAQSARARYLKDNPNESQRKIKIAGCLGPLRASYIAEAAPDLITCIQEYKQIVSIQQTAVDLFLIETMSNIAEATAALQVAKSSGKPVWLSFVPKEITDSNQAAVLRSGESFSQIKPLVSKWQPEAVLLNCASPETITHLIPELIKTLSTAGEARIYGAYANRFISTDPLAVGATVDVLHRRRDMNPMEYAQCTQKWLELGCTILGGCCEIGPDHIAALSGLSVLSPVHN